MMTQEEYERESRRLGNEIIRLMLLLKKEEMNSPGWFSIGNRLNALLKDSENMKKGYPDLEVKKLIAKEKTESPQPKSRKTAAKKPAKKPSKKKK